MTKLWCKTVLLLYHYHYSSRPAWDGSLLPAVFHSISRPSTGWASYAFNVAFIILSHPFAMTGFIYSESVYTIILSISAFLTTSITTNILRKGPPIPDDVHWSVQLCDSTNLKQISPRLALEVLEWHIFQKALTQLSQLLLKWKLASLEQILHAWIVHLIL